MNLFLLKRINIHVKNYIKFVVLKNVVIVLIIVMKIVIIDHKELNVMIIFVI